MASDVKDVKLCSKCKERPRAHPESTNPWCRQCNTEKQMEYQGTRDEMAQKKAHAEGCTAMREFIAGYFQSLGNAKLSGFEVSMMARKAGLPQ